MNIETQILSKISPDVIQGYSKETTHHDRVEFIPEAHDGFNDKKSTDVIGHINRFTQQSTRLWSIRTKFMQSG